MASVVCSSESGGPEALRACSNRAANAAPLRCDSTRLVVCEYPRHTRGAGGTRKARRHVAETHLTHAERGARSRLGAVDGSRGRAAAAARLLEVCCASVAIQPSENTGQLPKVTSAFKDKAQDVKSSETL